MKRDCYDFGAHKGCKSEDKIDLISEVVEAEKKSVQELLAQVERHAAEVNGRVVSNSEAVAKLKAQAAEVRPTDAIPCFLPAPSKFV